MERLGIVDEYRERRESIAERLSPSAKHQAFPTVYARPVPREVPARVDLTPPLRKEIERLNGEVGRLKEENARLSALAAAHQEIRPGEPPEPTIEAVMEAFCRAMNDAGLAIGDEQWSLNLLKTERRTRSIAFPRQVCMWLVKTLCSRRSLPQIGHRFGGRDHTTIMHGVKRAPAVLAARPDLLAVATSVLKKFGVVLARLEAGGQP